MRVQIPKKRTEDVLYSRSLEYRNTLINFTGETEEVKARGKKVDGFYLDGKMKFVGIAGVSDDFKGWFSRKMTRECRCTQK